MWIEDGNCMPREAKWAIFPPISLRLFIGSVLTHSWRLCCDTPYIGVAIKTKKSYRMPFGRRKKRKPGCIILQDKCIPEEKWLFNVIKTLSQLAICIHILTCTLSGWCRDIQSIFTNQFRTVSATAATKENTHAIIYSSYSSGSRGLFAYSV